MPWTHFMDMHSGGGRVRRVSDEKMVQHVAKALAAYFGESLEDLPEGDQSSYTAQARYCVRQDCGV